MQLDAILEVAIGLVFVWLVLSIGVMQVQEWIENITSWRSKYLEEAVRGMLEQDHQMCSDFFQHPAIQSLYRKTGMNKMPSNIPAERFSKVLLDVFVNSGKDPSALPADEWSIRKMQENLKAMQQQSPALAQKFGYVFKGIGDKSAKVDEKLSEWHKEIEQWFNDTMSQVSKEYKKFAQFLAFLIGIVIASALNLDSIHIAQQLWQEPTARAVLVAQAQAQVNTGQAPGDFQESVNSLNLPVGWNAETTPSEFGGWIFKVFGFLLSGAAAAQGAPFWFDILRNLTGLRKSETTQKSKTE